MLLRPGKTRELIRRAREQGVSIRRRLALYWACMALAVLSAALLLLNVTGVVSHAGRQFGETLSLQQQNSAAVLTAQVDALTAKGVVLSERIGQELDGFLAAQGRSFADLDDDPALIAALETALMPTLQAMLDSSACSGAYLCLDATANTALPEAAESRMGLYLRYSSLHSATPSGDVVLFRGAVAVARAEGVPLHNRWDPELDTGLIPGYGQVMAWSGDRLASGCLWTERVPLRDTWEDVTLLCVPILDGAGVVRGVCGVELSGLYFALTHGAVSSQYGSFLTMLAPLDGDTLLLDRAMLGDTGGAALTAEGTMRVREGGRYDTFTCGEDTYLGTYQLLSARLADGHPLAAVTLVPEGSFRSYALTVRLGWIFGSLAFLAGTLALSYVLSSRFARPITQGLAALQTGGGDAPRSSGISEIDELAAFLQARPQAGLGGLPPEIEAMFSGFAERAKGLTGTERILLGHYIDGRTIGEIPELMFISASTVKTHNRNIYNKLGVDSYDGLKVYLDLFRRCERLDDLLGP